ncbi:MAG TPA: DUF2231 domain-containing protein [Gemmatimonadales bacterium]|nr:DUF2231 domain-containing protein [Gemmatimonadales bacterium]
MNSAAPLHPILVHFSVALTAASVLFDFASLLLGGASLADAGWWTLALSAVMTVGTVATGVRSRLRLPMAEGPARSYLRTHMALGPIFLGFLLAATVWRATFWEQAIRVPATYLAAMGGLLLLMTVQGWLGGELVYRFGAEVRGRYRSLPVEYPEPEAERPPVNEVPGS